MESKMPVKLLDSSEAVYNIVERKRRRASARVPPAPLRRDPPSPLLRSDGSLNIAPDSRTDEEIMRDITSRYRVQSLQSFRFIEHSQAKGEPEMPVRLIDVSARQMPRSKVGKYAALEEVGETMKLLSSIPNGKAIQVDLDTNRYNAMKKDGTEDPARAIVSYLRRKFLSEGLSFKAYASDDKTVTVMREDPKPPRAKK